MTQKSKMQQTADFGSNWWNDSNDHVELQHACEEGAVGALLDLFKENPSYVGGVFLLQKSLKI